MQHPVSASGGGFRVRHQHQRGAVFAGLRNQRVHHFGGGGRVEVAGGFVGELGLVRRLLRAFAQAM